MRWFILSLAAAVILLALLGRSHWAYAHRPVLDIEGICVDQSAFQDQGPQQIEREFADMLHVKAFLSGNFNYAFLFTCSVEEFKGQRVPRLLFKSGSNIAEVLVLSDDQFNLAQSMEKPRFGSGNLTIELRPHPQDPKIAYLIIYSGDSIDWLFLSKPPDAA